MVSDRTWSSTYFQSVTSKKFPSRLVIYFLCLYPCRDGFTDTVALNYSSDIGTPQRVDIVCVVKGFKKKIPVPIPAPSAGKSRSISSSASYSDESTSISSVESPLASSKISVAVNYNFIPVAIKKASIAALSFVGIKSSLNSPITISRVVLRDPTDLSLKWISETKEVSWKEWISGKQSGISLSHGMPKPFVLVHDDESENILLAYLKKAFVYILQYHPLAWLLSKHNRTHAVISNITRIEKVFHAVFVISNSLLIEALLHGMTDSTLFFNLPSNESVVDWLTAYFDQTKIIYFSSCIVVLVIMEIVNRVAAGKWSRAVEDPVSYWQGTSPFRSAFTILKSSFIEMTSKICPKQNMTDKVLSEKELSECDFDNNDDTTCGIPHSERDSMLSNMSQSEIRSPEDVMLGYVKEAFRSSQDTSKVLFFF